MKTTGCIEPNQLKMKILAIASAGGHWNQLLRLLPAFESHSTTFVSTKENFKTMVPGHQFYSVPNATRWNKLGLISIFFKIFKIVKTTRPDVIITTGAAPGLMAIISGRLLGYKTLWIDSIANVEAVSLSGKIAQLFATRTYTQWPDLSNTKFHFEGNILS